ncbi:hypothetical protein PS685_01373 [Pseudomonas fluorescens]|uniref:DUF4365 domain-containing protein n=1 Tax=Pseudomonas fluorescens TaxID=294 RepID=A0A5E6YM31_PSEFL|nr:DUF4365 domain-containing protein [Pseudomonas fluorescens]VVN53844.1 hypothetical protein PS685_01373 [Pseudomonas fluorescens]
MNVQKDELGVKGERIAAKYLETIFDGETTKETMRGEGVGALDFQLKFRKNFEKNSYFQVGVQVKTGDSFGEWTPRKNRYRLQGIKGTHIKKWMQSNQPLLLIWVRPTTEGHEVYWKLITRKTPLETLSVSEHHLLTPASRSEIERLLEINATTPRSVAKITTHSLDTTPEIRAWASKKFTKIKGISNCCLGNIRISNYIWRHLTRVTRPQSHIRDSLTALPHIKNFLDIPPHQIQISRTSDDIFNGKRLIKQKILVIYRDIRFTDKEVCTVYIRLDEQIEFSVDWSEGKLSGFNYFHDVKAESIFRKLSKK